MRKGPGLLLRDIRKQDPAVETVVQAILRTRADILLLTAIDYDLDLVALTALRDRIREKGLGYDHLFALPPNSGVPTGFDLDRDGRLGGARDAQGFGSFTGQGAMAILSKIPIDRAGVQDLSGLLWRNAPNAQLPRTAGGAPYFTPEEQDLLRLSSTGHWIVPFTLADGGRLTLLAFAATPPVFDGPEDRNGLRNHDEIMLWHHVLDGLMDTKVPGPLAVLGNANLDPSDGAGIKSAIQSLLTHPRLQDPKPRSAAAKAAANPDHRGDPGLDTADFRDPVPGNLRVSYVLPSRDMTVAGAGVNWPENPEPASSSRHFPVWADVTLP